MTYETLTQEDSQKYIVKETETNLQRHAHTQVSNERPSGNEPSTIGRGQDDDDDDAGEEEERKT